MEKMFSKNSRLVIISNRLPVVIGQKEGKPQVFTGSGGLVTALAPVLRNRGGLWIGWPGPVNFPKEQLDALLKDTAKSAGFSLRPVILTAEDIQLYYNGFSNQIIWPLFHDLQSNCNFNPSFWYGNQAVAEKFAETIKNNLRENDFIWIHDYHFLTLGQELRKKGVAAQLSFFLHIPFPALDLYLKLPWRFQILRAMLDYSLIGFQTMRDARNFISCVKRLLPDVLIKKAGAFHSFKVGEREGLIGAFPISIDYEEFSHKAASQEVADNAWYFREKVPDRKLVFSLDRLDLTKGIPYRLEAIHHFLKKHPDMHGQVSFVQVVVPSRTEVPEYQKLKKNIDRRVSEINSQFTNNGWIPIHYIYRSIPRTELLTYYRTSEVALVTSIKDGMNLVAKEYIASNNEENGVLVLSEFAGAAAQLYKDALLINPYDIEGVSDAIYKAVTMPSEERETRMRHMRSIVRKYDIFTWVHNFINTAIGLELPDFPIVEEYTPMEEDAIGVFY